MSQGDNSPGISKLAGLMRQMVKNGRDTSLVLDFGVINGDYSLTTNTFPKPIPKKDYMVCKRLKHWTTATDGSHSHPYVSSGGSHSHNFNSDWKLKKGDRVLVAWVQNDAVVIDVILHANEIF